MSLAAKEQDSQTDRRAALVVVLLALLFAVVEGALSWMRYAAVKSDIDLAIFSQVVWNTARGRPFFNSILPLSEHYLGNHFSPILAVFAPLYLVWPDPRLLLLAQVLVIALAAWPLFRLAKERLLAPWAAVLLAAAFYLFPAVHHQNLADFHEVALGTTVVMWAFYALLTQRDLLLFCILPLMVLLREDVVLVIPMMGLYAFFSQRRRRLGAVLFVMGTLLSTLVLFVLIPAFRGGGDFVYTDYYDYLGDSPLAMARTVLLQPQVWLSRALYPPKLLLLVQLLLPVAFLPLLAPSSFLLGGSALAYLVLVDFPFAPIYTLESQYQALLIPFVFAGAVMGLERLARWLGPRWGTRRVALVGASTVLVASLVALALWGPLSYEDKRAEVMVTDQSRAEWGLLARIPPDASVLADARFAAPVSTRDRFYVPWGYFDGLPVLDYLLYEPTPVGYQVNPPALLGPPGGMGWAVPRYQLVGSAGPTELRQRSGTVEAAEAPAPVLFGDALALRGASGYGGVLSATPGQPLEVALVWEALRGHLPRLVPFVHLIERRPEGEYRWASADHEVYGGLFPTNWWQPGALAGQESSVEPRSLTAMPARDRPDLVGDVWTLELPPWLPPGQYELHVGLYTREGMERLPASGGGATPGGATTHVAATVDVVPPLPPDGAPPEVPVPTGLPLAEGLTLYGHNPIPGSSTAGQTLDVTVFWQAIGAMSGDYDVRFDLVAEGQATPAESWTRSPLQGRYPTTLWPPGSVLADWHPLPLPASLPTGNYHVRLTALDGTEPAGQTIELATVQIAPAD